MSTSGNPSSDNPPSGDVVGSGSVDYHLIVAGEQFGPHSEAEIKGKIQERVCGPYDLYWTEGMSEWKPLRLSPFANMLPDSPPPPPPRASSISPFWAKLDKIFRLVLGLGKIDWRPASISCGVGATLALCSAIALYDVSLESARLFQNIAKPVLGFCMIQWLILLYRLWRSLPEEKQRWITPRIVVILMFIPILNLIWLLFIYLKLVGYLEEAGAVSGRGMRNLVKNFLGAYLAVLVFSWHWMLGPIALVAASTLFILAHRALVEAVKALPPEVSK